MVYQDTHDPGSSLISIIPAALLGVRLVYRDTSDPGSSPTVQVAALLGVRLVYQDTSDPGSSSTVQVAALLDVGLVYQVTARRRMAEVILQEVFVSSRVLFILLLFQLHYCYSFASHASFVSAAAASPGAAALRC